MKRRKDRIYGYWWGKPVDERMTKKELLEIIQHLSQEMYRKQLLSHKFLGPIIKKLN